MVRTHLREAVAQEGFCKLEVGEIPKIRGPNTAR